MKLTHTHIDSFNRLSLGLIEKHGLSPEAALTSLESLQLSIVCGATIANSLPLQAALLTAINTSKRAFLGGVYVHVPSDIKCLLPWPDKKYLHEIISDLGGVLKNHPDTDTRLVFGEDCMVNENDLKVVCNDWQAGILLANDLVPFDCTGVIPTAGIFAGAFAVSRIFSKKSRIDITACDQATGVSLWRPDLNWLEARAKGPAIELLPQKFWLLGLGHLGQAYAWHIGLLPYGNDVNETLIMLQDDDRIVPANQSAGLLADENHAGLYKTRRCSMWLEQRGFHTRITERKFNENTKRMEDEPFVALCGFDSATARMHLEGAGFDLIAEAGLGSNLATFDRISLHTFPNARKTPAEIWKDEQVNAVEINEAVLDVLDILDADEKCGIVSRTISGKAVSASFVGACAGAFILAETLRALHNGRRYEKITFQLRGLPDIYAVPHANDLYGTELGRNGTIVINN